MLDSACVGEVGSVARIGGGGDPAGRARAVVTPVPGYPSIAVERPEEEYPGTDGKPMAENTWQATTTYYAGCSLATRFRGR